MKIRFVITLLIFSIIIAGCTSTENSFQNPGCNIDLDCKGLSDNAVCINGVCGLPDNIEQSEQSEQVEEESTTMEEQPQVEQMKIITSVFTNGLIPEKYTCDGSDTILPLSFENIPQDATSLALIMYDPDVPRNIRADGLWTHWIVFNIPITTTTISEGQEPQGTISRRYEGPCPPDREHRYFFKIYALDANIDLQYAANKQQFDAAIENHVLAEAELIGRYG